MASRLTKTIKNAKVGLSFYVVSIFVNFFSRKIFLEKLGDDFVGLTGTLQSFLGFLNLAELGLGTAIGFMLYKPIYDKDHLLINRLLSVFGSLYSRVGVFTLILGFVISLSFPFVFDENIRLPVIYYLFSAYLFSSLLSYFFNYNLFLLEADQKNYIVTKYYQGSNLIKLVLQATFLLIYENYYLWITLEILNSIIYSLLLNQKIRKEYPWLQTKKIPFKKIVEEFSNFILKVKQISIHKLSVFVLNGTDQILIFFLVDLQSVAFFGNYQMIFLKLMGLLNSFFAGTSAGIGNLVAENNSNAIKKVFSELLAIRFFVAGTICFSLLELIESFIELWIGNKYILDNSILIVMLLNLFIMQIRVPVDNFKQAYGLYSDTWAPIAQSLINLFFSIFLGIKYGILGIMLGTLISLSLIVLIWRPYFLFKEGFKTKLVYYWIDFFKLTLSFIGSFIVTSFFIKYILYSKINNYGQWIINAIIVFTVFTLIYSIFLFSISKGFRDFIHRLKKQLGFR